MTTPLRWGILGTGMIAGKFASQLPQTERGELVAVGSRSEETARAFTAEHGGRPCAFYDAVLSDADVDAVYLTLPNALHHEWTIKALEAGKHVLCEKPIAANLEQADQMFDAARHARRTLIEAFMYRCHPAVRRMISLILDGAIGEVHLIRTNFTFQREASPDDIRYQPQMAGGALMDVGCYCINLARAVAHSEPTAAGAAAHLHATGVDEYAAGILDFGGRALATFTCGMTLQSDGNTCIAGSEGYVTMDMPWFCNGEFRCVRGDSTDTITESTSLDLYALEAEAFAEVVQDGAEPWITPEDSTGNMQVLDDLRHAVGLNY